MTIYAEHEIPQVVGVEPTRPRVVSGGKQAARGGRAISKAFLPVCIHFSAYEVTPCLAFSNHRELIAAHQDFCRQRARIVV